MLENGFKFVFLSHYNVMELLYYWVIIVIGKGKMQFLLIATSRDV